MKPARVEEVRPAGGARRLRAEVGEDAVQVDEARVEAQRVVAREVRRQVVRAGLDLGGADVAGPREGLVDL